MCLIIKITFIIRPVDVAGHKGGLGAVDVGASHLVAGILAVRLPVARQLAVDAGAVVAAELVGAAVSASGLVGKVAAVVVAVAFGLLLHASEGRVTTHWYL